MFRPQVAWGAGPHYSRLSLGIVAPWGTHDESRAVTVGRNYWSFDPSFTYTYLSESGWDLSATAGVMINLENHLSGPNYETGDEAHIDALFGKHFNDNFALGIAGYWYNQLNDDKGPHPPPLEADYQSDGTGYGPVIMFGNKNISVVVKWLHDTHVDNRLDGDLYMLSFVARFGGEPPPPPPMPVAAPVAQVEPPPPPPPPPPPADADGDGVPDLKDLCPATPSGQRADMNGCSCDFTVQVHFKSNSTEITGADAITLNSLADQVRQLPTLSGELGGHTDSQGSEAFNLDLSRRRALAAQGLSGVARAECHATRGEGIRRIAADGRQHHGRRKAAESPRGDEPYELRGGSAAPVNQPTRPASVDLRDQHLRRHRLARIVLVAFAFRQHDARFRHLGVRKLLQQVIDAVEPRALLVDGLHHPPARFGNVAALEHDFLRLV